MKEVLSQVELSRTQSDLSVTFVYTVSSELELNLESVLLDRVYTKLFVCGTR